MAANMKTTVENRCVEVYQQFSLPRLDGSWAEMIWESDFSFVDPLPANFDLLHENTVWGPLLEEAATVCRNWAQMMKNSVLNDESTAESTSNNRGFWDLLVDNEFSTRKIIALCFYFMDKGQQLTSSVKDKETGIWAADLYCMLLAVPGSNAFNVFHPVPFQKAVDICKLAVKINTVSVKRKQASVGTATSSQSQRQNKKKKGERDSRKKKRQRNDEANDIDEEFLNFLSDECGSNEDDDDECSMDAGDIQMLTSTIQTVLNHLVESWTLYSLKRCEHSCYHVIERLAELTRLDCNGQSSGVTFLSKRRRLSQAQNCPLQQLGFVGLLALCSPVHGKIEKLHTQTMKQMMPNILSMGHSPSVKDNTIEFVVKLMSLLGEKAHPGVRILLQHLCVGVLDKAEHRGKVGLSVVTIMRELPGSTFVAMVKWIKRFMLNTRVNYRLFGVELIALLLEEVDTRHRVRSEGDGDNTAVNGVSVKTLLGIITARCSDKASSVRGKALQVLAHCAQLQNPRLQNALLALFKSHESQEDSDKENESVDGGDVRRSHSTSVNNNDRSQNGPDVNVMETDDDDEEVGHTTGNSQSGETLMEVLHRRFSDEKVHVRKAALQVLENLLKIEMCHMTKENVTILAQHCLDPALLIRKQVITSITSLLEQHPNNVLLHQVWVEGVLPSMVDRENSIQERCMETMETIILQNIVAYPKSIGDHHRMVWKILKVVADEGKNGSRRFLRKACYLWAQNGKIEPSLIPVLQTHIHTPNENAVWLLLAELAPYVAVKNASLPVNCWLERTDNISMVTLQRILTVIGCSTKYIPLEKAVHLRGELQTFLRQFSYPTGVIAAALSTLRQLYVTFTKTKDEANKMMNDLCVGLLKDCDTFLSDVILQHYDFRAEIEEKVICYLFTLGEVAQFCPTKVTKRTFLVIQSLIASPVVNGHADHADYDNPSSQGSLSSQGSQPLTQFQGSVMTVKIRAHAFVTLGKLCLQNETLAKKCAPALGHELEVSTNAIIRNNIVIVMADLCVRYTSLIDRYIDVISACLKDPSVIVRRQTLMLLTNLLQEDYIKWKGPLFFRFISTLVDDHQKIRSLAEFSLLHILLHRYPHMLYNHILECIFHFNAYTKHATLSSCPQSEREAALFSLRGDGTRKDKRYKLYRFMLDNMSDEHRFQITAKIVQDILGGVVDGLLPLDAHAEEVVRDALNVLVFEEIKLASLRLSPQDDLDEGDIAAAVVTTAKKTIITQVVKKNVIENIVPIIISLKHKLHESRSSLLRELLLFIKELMKDYKNEIKDILAADKCLAKEIEFDLRRLDLEQAGEERNRQRKSMQLQRINSGGTNRSNLVVMAKQTSVVPDNTTPLSRSLNAGAVNTPNNQNNNIPGTNNEAVVNVPEMVTEVLNQSARCANSIPPIPSPSTPIIELSSLNLNPKEAMLIPQVVSEMEIVTKIEPQSPVHEDQFMDDIEPTANTQAGPSSGAPSQTDARTSKALASPRQKLNRKDLLRAISTPGIPINNITFQDMPDDSGDTLPSPISNLSSVNRYRSELVSQRSCMVKMIGLQDHELSPSVKR